MCKFTILSRFSVWLVSSLVCIPRTLSHTEVSRGGDRIKKRRDLESLQFTFESTHGFRKKARTQSEGAAIESPPLSVRVSEHPSERTPPFLRHDFIALPQCLDAVATTIGRAGVIQVANSSKRICSITDRSLDTKQVYQLITQQV